MDSCLSCSFMEEEKKKKGLKKQECAIAIIFVTKVPLSRDLFIQVFAYFPLGATIFVPL